MDSSDGEDTSLVDPVSSSDDDVLKKFFVGGAIPSADVTEDMLLRHTLSADVTEDMLLQHALSVAAKHLIPRAKRNAAKPGGKPKAKPKANPKVKSGKCPRHFWGLGADLEQSNGPPWRHEVVYQKCRRARVYALPMASHANSLCSAQTRH